MELATHIEMTASMLRRDAAMIMKTALAGTRTSRLVDVIEAAFVGDEGQVSSRRETVFDELDDIPDDELDQALEETAEDETPKEKDTASTLSKAMKRKLPADEAGPSSKKASSTHPSKGGVCSLKDATAYFPNLDDKENYLHAGVDQKYISDRISSTSKNTAGYGCLFSDVSRQEGKIVPSCDTISSTKAQLSTHLRQQHLGIAVVCFVCSSRWWSASTWFKHMRSKHSTMKFDDYFLRKGAEEELQAFQLVELKQEVDPDNI